MRHFVLALLVGTLAFVPALADAQTGSGSGKPPAGTSGSSGSGSMPSSGTGSSGSGTSASPSGADMSTYKTQADCEKHGGMWAASTKSCTKK
jgi:hypothetical protein